MVAGGLKVFAGPHLWKVRIDAESITGWIHGVKLPAGFTYLGIIAPNVIFGYFVLLMSMLSQGSPFKQKSAEANQSKGSLIALLEF